MNGSPWPDDAQTLLLRSATADGAAALAAWTAFLALARPLDDWRLRPLLPAVYLNLTRRLAAGGFPGRDGLRREYLRTFVNNRYPFQALETVLPGLHAAGIPVMAIKGRAILDLHYGDLGARPSTDADILVPPERFHDAARHLQGLGWKTLKTQPVSRYDSRFRHSLAFFDPMGNCVDLHGRLLHVNCWEGIDDACWGRSRPFRVGDSEIRTLSDSDHLIQCCVHGIHTASAGKIYWLCDALAVLARRTIDWEALLDTVERRSVGLELRDTLCFARDRLGAEVPPEVLVALAGMTNWLDRLYGASTRREWARTRQFVSHWRARRDIPLAARPIVIGRYYFARRPALAALAALGRKLAGGALSKPRP